MFHTVAYKNLILTVGVWLAWQSLVCADSGTSLPASAPQAFFFKTTGELGEISSGGTISHEFPFTNRGKSPLEITAKTNCGCTVVDYDKIIPPGGHGKIKTELRTSSLRGEFHKSIEVQTNDPTQQRLQLVLSGRIVQTVELVSRQVPTMILKFDGLTELKIGLRTIEHVAVTGVTPEASFAQARIEPNGDREFQLHITVGESAPLGRSDFVLMVATNAKVESAIPITVSCEKGIVLSPSSFTFSSGRRALDASSKSMVLLRKREGKFNIRTAISSDPNLQLDVVPVMDGLVYRLTATYRGELSNLSGKCVVAVETDDPQQPRLEIPVWNAVRNTPFKASGAQREVVEQDFAP